MAPDFLQTDWYGNRGQVSFAARTGDTIDGTYRVAEVLPREIVFVYLPLDQRQRLVIHE